MKIGELAQRANVTTSRIRFYEKAGLLQLVDRQANGYRSYSRDALVVLELIDTAQKAGFSLDEIRTLLPSDLESWDHDSLLQTLRRKVAEITDLMTRLAHSKSQLTALIDDIESKPGDMSCAANAQRVLSRMVLAAKAEPSQDVL